MKTAIRVENLSKQYRLGLVGRGTMKDDFSLWLNNLRGKENILLNQGELNDRSIEGNSKYVWSLKDINFDINEGEVVGIIGKNGAGKSTLLKILSKITSPTTGSIKIKGRIASLLEVGTGFHPELTGRENIYLNGAILGMKKLEISRKIDEIIAFAGIDRYVDTPVKRYSSGMYVRLAFAVAAHLEPEILIIDEVLAVGDAEFQKKCLGKMNSIAKDDGRTILFVSHSMASIQNLCTKSIVLENGTTKFIGDVNDGIEFYLSKENGNLNLDQKIEFSTNRSGNGIVQFADFQVESENGVLIDTVLTGQDIVLVFTLKVNIPIANNVDIGFSFHNSQDINLASLYSSYQKIVFNDLKEGYAIIKCKINDFAFSPGSVIIMGRILENSNESDWYKGNLGVIEVQMGDFYQTGLIGQSNWGNMLIKGEWLKM